MNQEKELAKLKQSVSDIFNLIRKFEYIFESKSFQIAWIMMSEEIQNKTLAILTKMREVTIKELPIHLQELRDIIQIVLNDDDLGAKSCRELKDLAQKIGIKNYSRFCKTELINILKQKGD
jgi:hypothetical protein